MPFGPKRKKVFCTKKSPTDVATSPAKAQNIPKQKRTKYTEPNKLAGHGFDYKLAGLRFQKKQKSSKMAAKPQTTTAADQSEIPPTSVSNLNLHGNTGKQQSNKLGATAGNLILDFPSLKRGMEDNLCCRKCAEK